MWPSRLFSLAASPQLRSIIPPADHRTGRSPHRPVTALSEHRTGRTPHFPNTAPAEHRTGWPHAHRSIWFLEQALHLMLVFCVRSTGWWLYGFSHPTYGSSPTYSYASFDSCRSPELQTARTTTNTATVQRPTADSPRAPGRASAEPEAHTDGRSASRRRRRPRWTHSCFPEPERCTRSSARRHRRQNVLLPLPQVRRPRGRHERRAVCSTQRGMPQAASRSRPTTLRVP